VTNLTNLSNAYQSYSGDEAAFVFGDSIAAQSDILILDEPTVESIDFAARHLA
jgi:hypothetical protein